MALLLPFLLPQLQSQEEEEAQQLFLFLFFQLPLGQAIPPPALLFSKQPSTLSVISASEAAKAGILLDQYQDSSQIDFAFDDADVIEEETLIAVIGRQKLEGNESIIQQKSILNATNELVFMVTDKQYKGGLDGSIPVLVQSLNWMEAAEEIDDLFLGDAEVWRRPSIGQAGPMGGDFPVVTKEGLNILDVIFTSPIGSLAEVAESLAKVEGVVDHGLISKFPCTAVIASESGLCIVDNLQRKTVSDAL
uniref:Putative ribose-5-phosphate isomerase 4ic n=1 Tax=Rhizophora mucronata TaxID=61149 RepID=A0A2P2K269_RHIMU